MGDHLSAQRFISFMQSSLGGRCKLVSGGKELVTRCKYCADSSDPNHMGHMYIKVPQEPDDPILFHCFKCQTSGVVDSRTLLDWGMYDPQIAIEAERNNAAAIRHRKFTGASRQWFPFYNTFSNINLAKVKLDYINDRLGTSLTFNDCIQEKIILNLKDAIDGNRLDYTRHPNIVNQLNDNFVGFLSLDNNFVNLRRICNEGIVYEGIDKRYINYNIHGKEDNTEKMYVMPTSIDLTRPIKIPIHIAEGPFDILSIRHNLRKDEGYGIFAAVTGSGYKGLIRHLVSTYKIFYFDIHLYPDNDKFGGDYMIRDIMDFVRPYNAGIYEHRNVFPGEKDFGVHISRIDEKIYERYDM